MGVADARLLQAERPSCPTVNSVRANNEDVNLIAYRKVKYWRKIDV